MHARAVQSVEPRIPKRVYLLTNSRDPHSDFNLLCGAQASERERHTALSLCTFNFSLLSLSLSFAISFLPFFFLSSKLSRPKLRSIYLRRSFSLFSFTFLRSSSLSVCISLPLSLFSYHRSHVASRDLLRRAFASGIVSESAIVNCDVSV